MRGRACRSEPQKQYLASTLREGLESMGLLRCHVSAEGSYLPSTAGATPIRMC